MSSKRIKFIPNDQSVSLIGQEKWEQMVLDLLRCTTNGLHRVEKQLEKLTEEPIDEDEDTIV
jgi:hypothetical protein